MFLLADVVPDVPRRYASCCVNHADMGGDRLYEDCTSSFIITQRVRLEDAPAMHRTFRDKYDACIKVVMKPWGPTPHHTDPPSAQRQ